LNQKYLEKDNLDRCKKTIVHAFRLLMLSIQILETGSVVNYLVTRDLTTEMLNYYETDWTFYQDLFGPRFKDLRDKLSALVSKAAPLSMAIANYSDK
jgi:hypothetical protein